MKSGEMLLLISLVFVLGAWAAVMVGALNLGYLCCGIALLVLGTYWLRRKGKR